MTSSQSSNALGSTWLASWKQFWSPLSSLWQVRPKLVSALALIVLSLGLSQPSKAQWSCSDILAPHNRQASARRHITHALQLRSTHEWVAALKKSGHLIFVGDHAYKPGTDFLASNEFDWVNTPFDSKPTDLLIAFGTNSAWEIAANKSAKRVVLADWSPNPLLAHAYLIGPLLRISKTAYDFVQLLSAQIPNGSTTRNLNRLMGNLAPEYALPRKQIEQFLLFLGQQKDITDTELQFLSAYFWSRSQQAIANYDISPFRGLRSPIFANLMYFFRDRYSTTKGGDLHKSVLHNPELFTYLRNLFVENRIEYALTEVANPRFYELLGTRHSNSQDVTLSITNIFDVPYAGHTFQSMQRLFGTVIDSLGVSAGKPLTVFRTTNSQMPHGFYRYDINSKDDIPLADVADSKAAHENLYENPIETLLKAGGF